MSCELLTGATGFLGSHLLRDALAAGREVAVLVRRGRAASAEQRVVDVLARLGREGSPPPVLPKVIEGDLHQPDLGLDEASRGWIAAHCDRVVHCAASITFRAREGEPYLSNVDGTRYLLELCREGGIGDFHLVSTAYVCGMREGLVMETDVERGQEFSNDYERSKFMGEVLVRQAPFLDRWSIYRPSVIVGDSTTGFATTTDGLYAFLRVIRLFGGDATSDAVFARLGMSADDRINFVPVDWVSSAISHLVQRPGGASETYHLTHPRPVAISDLVRAVSGLGAHAPEVPERALDELLDVYRPYLKDHCEFDRAHMLRDAPHLSCPPLEGDVMRRLVEFVTASGFGNSGRRGGRVELALSVVGVGGATFDLTSPSAAREIAAEEADGARCCAHCTTGTLGRLLGEEMTAEQAVFAGLVALEGAPSEMERAMSLFESYLTAARKAAGDLAAREVA